MKPLEGIRVVELSTYVAAPSCARILADWGADVIKIEPPKGDIYRYLGVAQGMPAKPDFAPSFDNENANKRYLSLNLRTPEAMEVLHKLLATSDVFVTNYRPEALKGMKLDYDSLSQIHPHIVMGSILGYGDKGPDKDRPGFDFTAFYARSGMMADLSPKGSPLLVPVSAFGDHLAGMGLAGGIAAALRRKEITGKGDKVDAGLFQTGIYAFSSGLLSAYYGMAFPKGRYEGANPMVGSYLCKDGEYIYVSATDFNGQWKKFCEEVLGRPDLAVDERFVDQAHMLKNYEAGMKTLEEIMLTKTTGEWHALLLKADIAHEIVQHWSDVLKDEQAWANAYLREVVYENGKKTVFSNSPVTFRSIEDTPFQTSSPIGAHTAEIMTALGYGAEEIKTLAEAGKVRVG